MQPLITELSGLYQNPSCLLISEDITIVFFSISATARNFSAMHSVNVLGRWIRIHLITRQYSWFVRDCADPQLTFRFPPVIVTLTKRLVYVMRFLALPLGVFFFSWGST